MNFDLILAYYISYVVYFAAFVCAYLVSISLVILFPNCSAINNLMDCFDGTIPYSNLPTHTNKQYNNHIIQLLYLSVSLTIIPHCIWKSHNDRTLFDHPANVVFADFPRYRVKQWFVVVQWNEPILG